jgi:hypothetical protein
MRTCSLAIFGIFLLGACGPVAWKTTEYEISTKSFKLEGQKYPSVGQDYYQHTGRPLVSLQSTSYGHAGLSSKAPYRVKLLFRSENDDLYDQVDIRSFALLIGSSEHRIDLIADSMILTVAQKMEKSWIAQNNSTEEISPDAGVKFIYAHVEYQLLKKSERVGQTRSETLRFKRNRSAGLTIISPST